VQHADRRQLAVLARTVYKVYTALTAPPLATTATAATATLLLLLPAAATVVSVHARAAWMEIKLRVPGHMYCSPHAEMSKHKPRLFLSFYVHVNPLPNVYTSAATGTAHYGTNATTVAATVATAATALVSHSRTDRTICTCRYTSLTATATATTAATQYSLLLNASLHVTL
jgi:hypothetical protein